MKNTLLLIFAFLLSEFYNVAVSQDFAFYNINNLSGISMREVTAVVRDDDGFVWAASRTGVLRVATDDYQLYSLPFTTTDVMQIKMACRGGLLVVATQMDKYSVTIVYWISSTSGLRFHHYWGMRIGLLIY